MLDPPEQYWRIGPYLVEDETIEEVEKGVFIPFIHRPLSRYVNALADAGLTLRRMEEPAPPPGFLARAAEYEAAATIPRLLFLRCEKHGRPHERVRGHHRAVGRRALAGGRRPRGPRLVRHRQPAHRADPEGGRAGAGAGLRRRPGSPSSSGAGARHAELLPALAALRASGARVRQLFLEASTEVLVRRYESTRRRHPLLVAGRGPGRGHRARARRCSSRCKAEADVVVDTTDLNVHELHDRIVGLFGDDRRRRRHADHASCRSATSTASRSTSTWCSTAGSCPTRTGSRSCARRPASTPPVRDYVLGQPGRQRVPRAPRAACSTCCSRPTWPRARPTSPSPSAAPAAGTGRW